MNLLLDRLLGLRRGFKVGMVLGGFALAVLAGIGAVALHDRLGSRVDGDASGGMAAFGDAVLFLAVAGVVAIIPSVIAVLFLAGRRASRHSRRS